MHIVLRERARDRRETDDVNDTFLVSTPCRADVRQIGRRIRNVHTRGVGGVYAVANAVNAYRNNAETHVTYNIICIPVRGSHYASVVNNRHLDGCYSVIVVTNRPI